MAHVIKEYDDRNVVVEDVECIRNTAKAALVVINDEEHWVPQSQIHADSEVYQRGHRGKLVMSKWIAAQRELWESEGD